jgi:hypothetical protein
MISSVARSDEALDFELLSLVEHVFVKLSDLSSGRTTGCTQPAQVAHS